MGENQLQDVPNMVETDAATEARAKAITAAEAWMIRCSWREDDLSMCKPKADCVFGYEEGYLAALLALSTSTPAGELREVVQALLPFAGHKDGCALRNGRVYVVKLSCTCGFEAMRDKVGALAQPGSGDGV